MPSLKPAVRGLDRLSRSQGSDVCRYQRRKRIIGGVLHLLCVVCWVLPGVAPDVARSGCEPDLQYRVVSRAVCDRGMRAYLCLQCQVYSRGGHPEEVQLRVCDTVLMMLPAGARMLMVVCLADMQL